MTINTYLDGAPSRRVTSAIADLFNFDEAEAIKVLTALVASGHIPASVGRSMASIDERQGVFIAFAIVGRVIGLRCSQCAAFSHDLWRERQYCEKGEDPSWIEWKRGSIVFSANLPRGVLSAVRRGIYEN